jgi:hypothetical protein
MTERFTRVSELGCSGMGVVLRHHSGGATLLSDDGDEVAGRLSRTESRPFTGPGAPRRSRLAE